MKSARKKTFVVMQKVLKDKPAFSKKSELDYEFCCHKTVCCRLYNMLIIMGGECGEPKTLNAKMSAIRYVYLIDLSAWTKCWFITMIAYH